MVLVKVEQEDDERTKQADLLFVVKLVRKDDRGKRKAEAVVFCEGGSEKHVANNFRRRKQRYGKELYC